jgi:hypothetical protein
MKREDVGRICVFCGQVLGDEGFSRMLREASRGSLHHVRLILFLEADALA